MVKYEEHYYADPMHETVIAIHMSLKGLEDLYYMLSQNDQFAKDLWKYIERMRDNSEDDDEFPESIQGDPG